MARAQYDWEKGVDLAPHTARKHQVLRKYFEEYLRIRCAIPQQKRFKLAVIDGFAGGGRYSDGEAGSPIIFIETLAKLSAEINIERQSSGMAPLEFGCHLFFNDENSNVIERLKEMMAPVLIEAQESAPKLFLDIHYRSEQFEEAYPKIREQLINSGCRNVLFNLDQYGDKGVSKRTLRDILSTFSPHGEIFLTFSIKPLLTFLQKSNLQALQSRLAHLEIDARNLEQLDSEMNSGEWLGTAESIVFDNFRDCANYVSTFSITNPNGWRYWLIHFSNVFRARQVYNDILHKNANLQAHFGRSGLNLSMHSYNPRWDGQLYLFKDEDRQTARNELMEDIPKVVKGFGDSISVEELFRSVCNLTPSHSEDINNAMLLNPDLEVLTLKGNPRRKPNAIRPDDTLRMKAQKSFFSYWNRIDK